MCVCLCVCVCAASTSAREHLRDAALGLSITSALSEDDSPNAVVIHTSKVCVTTCGGVRGGVERGGRCGEGEVW